MQHRAGNGPAQGAAHGAAARNAALVGDLQRIGRCEPSRFGGDDLACQVGPALVQPGDRLGGGVGMKRREHQVAGKRSLDAGFGRFPIAYLADHDHEGIGRVRCNSYGGREGQSSGNGQVPVWGCQETTDFSDGQQSSKAVQVTSPDGTKTVATNAAVVVRLTARDYRLGGVSHGSFASAQLH